MEDSWKNKRFSHLKLDFLCQLLKYVFQTVLFLHEQSQNVSLKTFSEKFSLQILHLNDYSLSWTKPMLLKTCSSKVFITNFVFKCFLAFLNKIHEIWFSKFKDSFPSWTEPRYHFFNCKCVQFLCEKKPYVDSKTCFSKTFVENITFEWLLSFVKKTASH